MALVPLAGGWLSPGSRLALLLANLFAFNLIRGICTCGWLPWISALIPAALRGRYLVRDAACQNVGGVAVFVLAAFVLGEHSELGSFRKRWKWFHLFRFPPNWVRSAILPAGL